MEEARLRLKPTQRTGQSAGQRRRKAWKSCGDLGTGHGHTYSPTSCKRPACEQHVRCSYHSQGRLGKEGSFLFRERAAWVPIPTQPTHMWPG